MNNILLLLVGSDYVISSKAVGRSCQCIASVAHLLVVEPSHPIAFMQTLECDWLQIDPL
jgi:hypothetical protein